MSSSDALVKLGGGGGGKERKGKERKGKFKVLFRLVSTDLEDVLEDVCTVKCEAEEEPAA